MITQICQLLLPCLALTGILCTAFSSRLAAQEQVPYLEAPPNQVVLSDTLNGWYFVPKEMKEEYDAALRRLESLQSEVDSGNVTAEESKAELAELKSRLQKLRAQLETNRVHVAAAEIHEQTEVLEFELGPEKRLAITSNHVRVLGWDEPRVKVELRKIVLSENDEPVEEHLNAISVVHQHGRAQFAGQTDAEWDASEAEFLAADGAKLTKEQLENREKIVNEIRASYAIHRELLGKEIDQLSVKGLEYANNSFVNKKVRSEGGDGQWGSVRQRYAEMTVYVPSCTSVVIRGARRSLQVENLTAALTIVDEDSTDSDARGHFEIHKLQGNLRCRNFPLHSITSVTGDVDVESTSEFGVEGAGTRHYDDLRDMTPARPFAVSVLDVTGGVSLHYGRVQLDLKNIGGTIDVANEFGDTQLILASPLSQRAHRIVTQSGDIAVELSSDAWKSVPVVAVTNHGGIRTNVPREEFEDFNLTGADKYDRVRRTWAGFRTPIVGEERFAVFHLIDRFTAVLNDDRTRDVGLDLLSRSGRIVILRK